MERTLDSDHDNLEDCGVYGRLRGYVHALHIVTSERGFELTQTHRARIEYCENGELLRVWIRRAVRAPTVDDIFDKTSI
jgi:hypothetical protein